MDDWRQKIQRSLRDSPNYLASPYCRWEWEDYVRYETRRQCWRLRHTVSVVPDDVALLAAYGRTDDAPRAASAASSSYGLSSYPSKT